MVLHPIVEPEAEVEAGVISAWTAVERRQRMAAARWLLISQADHAILSGQIAAHVATAGFPYPPPEVVRAIRVHDAGWSYIEGAALAPTHGDGRPISFFEVAPEQFLAAWRGSIEGAAGDSAAGGYIVSRHFSALAEFRIGRAADPPETLSRLRAFVAGEQERQQKLKAGASAGDWEAYVLLLQFCDILSLYLCSGTPETVEFAQSFAAGKVRARRQNARVSLHPTPFRGPLQVKVPAREWPPGGGALPTLEINVG